MSDEKVLRYYIDSSVLLRVGQPDLQWLHDESLAFLKRHEGELAIGPMVSSEVTFQLRQRHGEYLAIEVVKRWLYRGCVMIPLSSQEYEFASAMALLYKQAGWDGEPGDAGDRTHAAVASVGRLPTLVTWDKRFLAQDTLIAQVNRDAGLSQQPPTLLRPDRDPDRH